jgi:hypothetical protein
MKIIKIEAESADRLKYLEGLSLYTFEIRGIDVESEMGQMGPETYYVGKNHSVTAKIEVNGEIALGQFAQALDTEFIKAKIKADLISLNSESFKQSNFKAINEAIGLIREQESSVENLEVVSLLVNRVSVPIVYNSSVKIIFDLIVTFFEPGDPSVVNQEWSKAWNASRRPV